MLQAILIDDDIKTLDLLEEKLHNDASINVISKHMKVIEGLIAVVQHNPEILFINIEMSNQTFEIVKEIKHALPTVLIIFLAKTDKYALQAFEYQALDYLVKPFTDERLMKTINKIDKSGIESEPKNFMIRCFKQLDFVEITDKLINLPVVWRTSKAKAIFAYLLHHKNNEVRKDVLIGIHWPKSNEKEAYSRLYTTIYHIRKTIGLIGLPVRLVNKNAGYQLEMEGIRIDVDVFQESVLDNTFINNDNVETHRQTLELYRGDYFEVEDYSWAKNTQNRLHFQYVNYAKKIADYYLSIENFNEAIIYYTKIQKSLPFHEDSYFELMKLYYQMGDIHRTKEYYEKLCMMSKKVDKKPRVEITDWYNNNV